MVFENGVKNIQAAAYNGAGTDFKSQCAKEELANAGLGIQTEELP